MIKVGMMIAERYEIIEKIGTGGMSDVYRAKCHKLNRFVAVKVLKQEFSENTDFVSKFRVEAQAAAGLMHPNIVNVYDVGEESGFHYIVMELVEGITLKKYIEKKARLSVKEAVSIAIQVSMGIEAAHNNHIIHRDIKPQNIIISKEGKVKVTDFGIAKAATSNTITSNVMGSVHYTSPEQVRGGFSDEKSDIYSLGITLFEMLTGRVPFNGETTVAVAIKHIQEQMISPREYVPEIPISVEQIVLKCTQKSPDRRYQYAPELIEDLKKSLISPDEDFVKIEEADNNGVTKNISGQDLATIKKHHRESMDAPLAKTGNIVGADKADTAKIKKAVAESAPEPVKTGSKSEAPKKATSTEQPRKKNSSGSKNKKNGKKNPPKNTAKKNPSGKNAEKEEEYDPKMELLTNILVVVAAVIIGCIFLYIVTKALGIDLLVSSQPAQQTQVREQVEMVPVVGLDVESAKQSLTAAGLVPSVEYEASQQPKDVVLSASCEVGTMVDAGTTVILKVSSGQEGEAIVPSVVGLTKPEATAQLEAEGFEVTVTRINSETVPKDAVIEQIPAGNSSSPRGTTVEIIVSLGAEVVEVQVPNILNMSEEDAIVTLVEHGLTGVMVLEEYNDLIPAGYVCYQNYSEGITVNSGTEIEFRVSMGPEQVLYNCITSVAAPADYAGGNATVVLQDRNGVQLFATTTTTFPVEINVSNIFAMSSGEIYITYNVTEQQQTTDAAGNVSLQPVQVQKVYGPQAVTFIRAQ